MWQPSLNYVEKYYSITNDESDSSGQKRRFKTWVTDAIFLPNCNKLVIGSTSRDIRFYDCSTNQHFEEFQLFGENFHLHICISSNELFKDISTYQTDL